MNVKNKIVQKEKVVQAVVVSDTFTDDFIPMFDGVPYALLPLLNKPLIDYTLEFLSLGGIEEVFLFCCKYSDNIKQHIDKCIHHGDGWTLTMKVNVIISESCQSFGDCLRDLDAKGLLRGDFVLLEPGVVSNIKLLPLLKKHNEITKTDKYAAMSLVLQESGIGYIGRDMEDDILLGTDTRNRLLFYKKLGKVKERKVKFPVDMFLENSDVSLFHNLKDTRIAICSSSVLPLFSDNFDFQSKDDLIRGLLMNEEILEGTVYINILRGSEFGAAVSSWRMYQALSKEIFKKWIHPLTHPRKINTLLKDDVVVGTCTKIPNCATISNTVLGANIVVGTNVTIKDSFIFSDTKIGDNVIITHSIVGSNCVLKDNTNIRFGSVIGHNTILEKETVVENALIQSTKPHEHFVKLGDSAFEVKFSSEDDDNPFVSGLFNNKKCRLYIKGTEDDNDDDDLEEGFSDSEEELSYTQSPVPDDTKLFFTEVIDSLTRGFEDNLLCDNLILEINSSRYAYNVTVKEVNFNVVKAILSISLRDIIGTQLSRLLSYFAPVLKNYLRNESAMLDCLQAIEDVAISNENIKDKWVMAILQHLYNEDYVTEDIILEWFNSLDNNKLIEQIKPFTDWLQEAEEASSDDDSE